MFLGLGDKLGGACDCAGKAGCAGDGERFQGSLRKKSGAAAQAFKGFPGAMIKSLQ